jgi:hypothetical protein
MRVPEPVRTDRIVDPGAVSGSQKNHADAPAIQRLSAARLKDVLFQPALLP